LALQAANYWQSSSSSAFATIEEISNMATFQAKSDRGEVITIIERTSVRPAGSFDDPHGKIKGLSTFLRADNHNALNANQDFTEFTEVRTKVVYRRI
jgi:hypothetical protein